MDSQVAEHLRETQNLVHEFNRAQELLKDKVSALQLMYVFFVVGAFGREFRFTESVVLTASLRCSYVLLFRSGLKKQKLDSEIDRQETRIQKSSKA